MTPATLIIRRGLCATAACAALMAGCAAPPPAKTSSGAVFYPPLPNPVRIQHLTTISGERDIGGKDSEFARFVLGSEDRSQRLKQPYGVAMHDGRLYVVDTGAPGVAVFDVAGRKFNLITGGAAGRMKRPINITIDTDGTKYVTDTGRNQVLVFDNEDRFVSAFGAEKQMKPVDSAIIGDKLYVVDIEHHAVQVLDKRSGKKLSQFGTAGSEPGQMFHPTNIAVGPDGSIYVVETSNFRVQRFTQDGVPVRSYGQAGSTVGSFARPKGIAVDRTGRMYVSDAAFENVQVFDNSGRLLLYFGQPGDKSEGLNLPTGVSIDYDNVDAFRRFADPDFKVEYLIFVASQFGPNKIDVFGFGRMKGLAYPADDVVPARLAGQASR